MSRYLVIVENINPDKLYIKNSNNYYKGKESVEFIGNHVVSVNGELIYLKNNNEYYFDKKLNFTNFGISVLNKIIYNTKLPFVVIFKHGDCLLINNKIEILAILSKLFPVKNVVEKFYSWELKSYASLLNLNIDESYLYLFSNKIDKFDLVEYYKDLDIVKFDELKIPEKVTKNEESISLLDLYDLSILHKKDKMLIEDINSFIKVPKNVKNVYLYLKTIFIELRNYEDAEEIETFIDELSKMTDLEIEVVDDILS